MKFYRFIRDRVAIPTYRYSIRAVGLPANHPYRSRPARCLRVVVKIFSFDRCERRKKVGGYVDVCPDNFLVVRKAGRYRCRTYEHFLRGPWSLYRLLLVLMRVQIRISLVSTLSHLSQVPYRIVDSLLPA